LKRVGILNVMFKIGKEEKLWSGTSDTDCGDVRVPSVTQVFVVIGS